MPEQKLKACDGGTRSLLGHVKNEDTRDAEISNLEMSDEIAASVNSQTPVALWKTPVNVRIYSRYWSTAHPDLQ